MKGRKRTNNIMRKKFNSPIQESVVYSENRYVVVEQELWIKEGGLTRVGQAG